MEMKSFLRGNLDRVLGAGLALAGIVAIIVGWFGVSGTGLAPEQIPYVISGGIGGIALIALGCTAWISADLQDEWRRLDAIEERLLGSSHATEGVDAEAASTNGGTPPARSRKRSRVASDANP